MALAGTTPADLSAASHDATRPGPEAGLRWD
jgi:hypothetical protein